MKTSTAMAGLGLLTISGGAALFGGTAGLKAPTARESRVSNFPSYSRNINQFDVTLFSEFRPSDRNDKSAFSGAPVVMIQATPPGYIASKHPTIAKYDMQKVTEQSFFVNGKELKFVANPTGKNMDYWTLGKDEYTGWDANVLVFKPTTGTDTIKVEANYKGFNSANAYVPGTKTGAVLSPQERKEFTRLDEAMFETTKPAMDAALGRVGLLRSKGEDSVVYGHRLSQWVHNNIPFQLNSADDNVIAAILEKRPGNCNQIADIEAFALRSQGIPARIVSGADISDKGGHAFCELWDDKGGVWLRMGEGKSGSTVAQNFNGSWNTNQLVFQIDTTFGNSFNLPKVNSGPDSTTGCGEWILFDNGQFQANKVPQMAPSSTCSPVRR